MPVIEGDLTRRGLIASTLQWLTASRRWPRAAEGRLETALRGHKRPLSANDVIVSPTMM